ncbi:MAG: DegT/DnrJ/EryC1/StrS family aminotransferase [Treponema sp.]|jgi:dTDP-4-amino-4,6-dideoxygalactose transaminase|nr:DegT/DnrJ/EryC1/StrS family aminotransferase [Treponema sp.]
MKIEVTSPTIRRKEMDAVLTAMVEEKIGPGDRSRLLIQTAKEHLKFDYALALRSPAVALYLALKALNVKNGQAVVISALSPRYYLQVLEDLQLTPLYCDVNHDFPCINREGIENVLAKKPSEMEIAAIVVHHTLGYVPDSASIVELGIPVIEDISHSYKAVVNGVFCILGLEERDALTAGGGAILFAINRKDGTLLRNFTGIADEYCLPDINAALAVVQFKEMQRNLERRKEIANVYKQSSLRTRHKSFIMRASNEASGDEDDTNYYSFSLVLETGLKDVIAYAKRKDIILENAFERTIAGLGPCENCPVSNSLALRTVLFPMYPRLSAKDVDSVSRLIMTLP